MAQNPSSLHSVAGCKLDQIWPQLNLVQCLSVPCLLLPALELHCTLCGLHLQLQLHGCGCPVTAAWQVFRLGMTRLTESAATHGCNCLHEMLALVEYEFLIVCMYSLRACILSCALCAGLLEVGCKLTLQLREMRIHVRRISSEPAIAQNIRVANSNRNQNCVCE